MDFSGEGMPCSTVYPRSDRAAYWGSRVSTRTFHQVPSREPCRQLFEADYSYAEAVTFWLEHGQPSLMDASGVGRPCSTVYPPGVVDDYWG